MTAVIVSHDGAAWLPRLLDALEAQTRRVSRVVAADTGSRDASRSVLTARLGEEAVLGLDRSSGYAAAVDRAVLQAGDDSRGPEAPGPGQEQVQWLWLLHDDCEPAPDALEQLLRGAAGALRTAVAGPKQLDWADRDKIVEAGLTIDTAGRRVTGVEAREADHGQHDGDRDTLAVSSAGMLVRAEVWERLGGFDPALPLFGEDIDFCWRVHQAGLRVRLVTGAVLYHARAASNGRRDISVGRRSRLLDRRAGLLTLLGNLPLWPMLAVLAGNLCLSALRTLVLLIGKRPGAALDECAAVGSVLGSPLRLVRTRRYRSRGRRTAHGMLRGSLPPGRSVRRVAEMTAMLAARPATGSLAGRHHVSDDPDADDSMLTDTGVVRRILTRPGVLLVLALIVIAAVAERRVLTGGLLGGGALLPARDGASGLWSQFLQAYHTVGTGSGSAAPPYLGLLAVAATVTFGKAWLAVDILLLGCVPLAGLTAYAALGLVTRAPWLRVWAAAAYALLPVAFGAIAAGRLGSAVAFALIPAIGGLAGRMLTQPGKGARRAAWAAALTITVAGAFVPLLLPLTVVFAVIGAVARRRVALAVNLVIVAVTPLVLLSPWLAGQLRHPAMLLLEAGVQQPGLAAAGLPARSLVLLSPGGPGLPPFWASAALLVTGLAALLATRRHALVAAGWAVALLGLAAALAASRIMVTPAGGMPVNAWPGAALAVAAAGLLLAATAAADGMLAAGWLARRRLTRTVPAAVLAVVACTAPVIAAGWWLVSGVAAPLGRAPDQVVPPLVANAAATGRQVRTLVLTAGRTQVSYLLLRGTSPEFSYPDVAQDAAAQSALSRTVAGLVAPGGSGTANQARQLAGFDVGFVLVRAPVDARLASALDSVAGLTHVSTTPTFDLWQLASLPSRVSVAEPNGQVAAVKSGPVSVTGAAVPAAGGTLLLAEPSGGWTARLNGQALTPVPSPAGGWAQAFRLPPGGGQLTLTRNGMGHDVVISLQLLLFLIVAALALPGVRTLATEPDPAAGSGDARDAGDFGDTGDSRDSDGVREARRERPPARPASPPARPAPARRPAPLQPAADAPAPARPGAWPALTAGDWQGDDDAGWRSEDDAGWRSGDDADWKADQWAFEGAGAPDTPEIVTAAASDTPGRLSPRPAPRSPLPPGSPPRARRYPDAASYPDAPAYRDAARYRDAPGGQPDGAPSGPVAGDARPARLSPARGVPPGNGADPAPRPAGARHRRPAPPRRRRGAPGSDDGGDAR